MSPRRRKCAHCAKLTIPGLVNPLCQYHYDVSKFGQAWADKCRAEDEAEPKTMARVQQMVEDRWPRKPYNVWITDSGRQRHVSVRFGREYHEGVGATWTEAFKDLDRQRGAGPRPATCPACCTATPMELNINDETDKPEWYCGECSHTQRTP